jgi:uncharacterized protein involved in exopolysaccharide biosynthesis
VSSPSDDATTVVPAVPQSPLNGAVPAGTPWNGSPPVEQGQRQLRRGQAARLSFVALVIVVLGAAAGFAASLQFPVQYAARAELVYLIGQEEPTGFLREDRNLTTQVLLLGSRSVLEPVATTEGLTVKDLENKFHAELVEGSEVINVEVHDESREAGQAILTRIIDRYRTVSNDVAPAETRAYLQTQLDDVRRRLADAGLGESERGALTERETTLLAQVDSLNLAGAQVKVVVAPYSAPEPVSPQPLLGAAAGALVGVLVAGTVVLVQARRWTRV